MLVPAMKKYRAAIGLLVGMPGNPTIYAGDELGETGFEHKFKNTFVQNRNLIHYNRAEHIQEIEDRKNEIAKLMNLRKDKAFSPLVNGSTVVLDTKQTKEVKEENKIKTVEKVSGIYRYNDEKDMIILFNNEGFGMNRDYTGEPVSVQHIDLSEEKQLNDAQDDVNSITGVTANLEAGTVYRNALDKEDKATYKVIDYCGTKLLKKHDENGNPVDNTMKEQICSYTGKITLTAQKPALFLRKFFKKKSACFNCKHEIQYSKTIVI